MKMKYISLVGTILLIIFSLCIVSDASRDYGTCSKEMKWKLNTVTDFECNTGGYISRSSYCDGNNDCSDTSDEVYCSPSSRRYGFTSCSKEIPLFHCIDSRRCIPSAWVCDGISDCDLGDDEKNCVLDNLSPSVQEAEEARKRAVQWILEEKNMESIIAKGGPALHKTAIALFLTSDSFPTHKKKLAYEIKIHFLSQLIKNKLQDIPSADLASLVNALLVTCLDPRDFYGMNIIKELRNRVDSKNYTNPYVFLALCKAGETITESDTQKVINGFSSDHRVFWTDTKALAIMALSCAKNQTDSPVDSEHLKQLTLELKNHQYRNGTVENLQTTALVMQALYASEFDEDSDNFDEAKALKQILQQQETDGSFGSLIKTYYVLPVLNCRSLMNISTSHCKAKTRNEDTALNYLDSQVGPKIRIQYSIWISNDKTLERTLTLRVPQNISFYKIMELAGDLDDKYKFEYVVRKQKPYVNVLSGLSDDPEIGKFWFLYIIEDGKPTLVHKSPADVMAKDNSQFVMWYRRGPWIE